MGEASSGELNSTHSPDLLPRRLRREGKEEGRKGKKRRKRRTETSTPCSAALSPIQKIRSEKRINDEGKKKEKKGKRKERLSPSHPSFLPFLGGGLEGKEKERKGEKKKREEGRGKEKGTFWPPPALHPSLPFGHPARVRCGVVTQKRKEGKEKGKKEEEGKKSLGVQEMGCILLGSPLRSDSSLFPPGPGGTGENERKKEEGEKRKRRGEERADRVVIACPYNLFFFPTASMERRGGGG